MLNSFRSYFYKYKSFQKPLEKFVFPLVLLLYPLIGVNYGLDITDTTYSLANYEFLKNLNPMWMLSTFLSNATGAIIMHFPFADTMLGFGVYCSFIISIIALIVYYQLMHYMPGWMIFIGLFISESLCWCPRVSLYNYLTYLFFSLGVLFLLKGIFAWEKQNLYLFLAGVFLGINIMVRFPNITEAALILVLWFYAFITKQELLDTVKKTFICILGYFSAVFVLYIITCVLYGSSAYFGMIGSLFGMTESASDYSTGGMIAAIINAYLTTFSNMIILLPCIVAGIVMFMIRKGQLVLIKKLAYMAGLLILIKYFFSKGVFTRNYFYYDSMFQAAMMFVIIAVVLCIIGSTGFLNGSKEEQTLAFAALMIILITPIGSNNYTFPVINNLFVVAPITLWVMRRLMQRLGEGEYNFAWQSMITMVIGVVLVQGFLFHISFSFVDGADGSVRDASSEKIQKVSGMITTRDNVYTLEELGTYLEKYDKTDSRVLLFGAVPGLSYIFDLEPAIDTVWPDLDSYTTKNFEEQLLSISGKEPLVIVGKTLPEYASVADKYDILMDYIDNHDYNIDFENERFIVYSKE